MPYVDKINIIMSNKKFKYFDYQEEQKDEVSIDFLGECKINALDFYRLIEFLDKIGTMRMAFIVEEKNLILKSELPLRTEFVIPLLYPIKNLFKSGYSAEYLRKILKNYKPKELENEFVYLEFGNDTPMKIKFNDKWIILSPCIEQNE